MMDLLGFSGAEKLRAKMGAIAVPGAIGNVAYTGIGFKPVALLSMTLPGNSGSEETLGVGMTDGTTQGVMGIWGNDAGLLGGGNAERRLLATRCVGAPQSGGWDYEASIVSFDDDGFTLNWTNAGAGTVYYLALG